MKLQDAIKIVRRFGLNINDDEHPEKDIVIAIQAALHDLNRECHVARSEGTKTVTANESEVDVSTITGFRAERFIRAEIQFPDQGEWAVSTAYSENDLVQGDGSPNSLYYVCKEAHTSGALDEPGLSGGTAYWRQVAWKRGDVLTQVDFTTMSRHLSLPSLSTPDISPSITATTPERIAFSDATTAYLWPTPDTAFTLNLTFRDDLVDLTSGNQTINIDDEYIHPALIYGATSYLQHMQPENAYANTSWQKFQEFIRKVKGDLGFTERVGYPDEEVYL